MARFQVGSDAATLALASALVLAACSVDERVLTQSGANGGGAGAATGSSFAAGASDGGEGGVEIAPLPICTYGASVMEGCETLVENPGFASDASGWDAEMPSITMAWNAADASSDSHSGSLAVMNALSGAADGIADRGASQCLLTAPGRAYGFAADIYIPEGQGDGIDGGTFDASAAVSVIFYASADCTGFSEKRSFSSDASNQAGSWSHREGRAVAPAGAQSMLVRLVTLKNFREYTFEARFDNVLVRAN
jgi:hypothetical protein